MIWTYLLAFGAFMAAIGVGAGAFGAHGLKDRLTPPELAIFETSVRYWMYHSFGICIVSLVMSRIENWYMKSSAISMILGALVFSISLILLVFTGNRQLGAITPIGGVFLILSWLLLGLGVLLHR
ncbi:MAG: DUF423 domain-containing protein [Proteobacteria bacterium]|jgi:uncharacterized membrane protein YgdD (TMEM256/DUF423 family)|nr:DUF423 domain-containing protein [Pseudomonadota bacterium]